MVTCEQTVSVTVKKCGQRPLVPAQAAPLVPAQNKKKLLSCQDGEEHETTIKWTVDKILGMRVASPLIPLPSSSEVGLIEVAFVNTPENFYWWGGGIFDHMCVRNAVFR